MIMALKSVLRGAFCFPALGEKSSSLARAPERVIDAVLVGIGIDSFSCRQFPLVTNGFFGTLADGLNRHLTYPVPAFIHHICARYQRYLRAISTPPP
jgi:hypothetical protein